MAYQKIYNRIIWENEPSTDTPLNEDNLNRMDYTIDQLDDRIVEHEQEIDALQGYEPRASQAAAASEQSANESADSAILSESWAIGGTDTRIGEDTNNSKYWSEQSNLHTIESESWAHGGTDTREGEDTDNSMYWSIQSHNHELNAENARDDAFELLENIEEAIAEAIETNVPNVVVNLTDGHLYWQGGKFGFDINESNGHLMWEIT